MVIKIKSTSRVWHYLIKHKVKRNKKKKVLRWFLV